ncbi:MAG: penicillin-binding protein 1C [Rhodobacteraceae bacterium]|nr:penicillin-binding protein 1C [Paracoccaceae bacterium]
MRRYGLFFLSALLFGAGLARDRLDAWVATTDLPVLVTQTGIEVRDRNDHLLRAYTVADGRWRLAITQDAVDPLFLQMLVAYEDKRFFSHNGVDLRAASRAAGQALLNGRVVSGGSTLTMQVARLLQDGSTGRWAGKLRQARLALALERQLSKEQILALYLHRAPYGGNLEGVRAASLAWFGKEAKRLTPAQVALLVALPQSPERRRPDQDASAAQAARDRVLARMQDAGVIDRSTAQAALREPLQTRRQPFPALAPHAADRALAGDPGLGLHRLTLDASLQHRLEQLGADAAARAERDLSVALVVADHRSAEILASVGSAGFADDGRQGFVDMTRALRSPGSTLKPLVYGLAFDAGLAHPETLIDDRPTAFGTYAPQNFDGEFRGTVKVRDALQLSLNLPVVALTEALGPAKLMAGLRRAGVSAQVPGGKAGLAVALGGLGVSLEDLVGLYAGFANAGVAVPLQMRIGAEVSQSTTIIPPEAAWHLGEILSDITPPGGGATGEIAWKTGTSYGHRDAWALGWDGAHVVGVWIGRPDGTPVPGAFGADLAAPLLFDAFARIGRNRQPLPPPPPATLVTSTAKLPAPLQRFQRKGSRAADPNAPAVAFPPSGARLSARAGALTVKVRDGRPPFLWLSNGAVVSPRVQEREVALRIAEPGFYRLTVIDADGRAARSDVRLD